MVWAFALPKVFIGIMFFFNGKYVHKKPLAEKKLVQILSIWKVVTSESDAPIITVGGGWNTPTVSLRVVWGDLKGCPDGSVSTVWDFTGFLFNLDSLGWRDREAAQNAATILKLIVPYPNSTLFYLVQHVADWVVPFLSSQHSPPPPLEFFPAPPPPPPSSSPSYVLAC